MSETPSSPRATRRDWLGLMIIALPGLVVVMDLTILYLAVPTLTAALKPSPSQLLWIVDIYGFLLAGLLITMGTLGDRIGRRRLLMIGAVAFAAASTLAAFSTSVEMLIAARALLGIAGATGRREHPLGLRHILLRQRAIRAAVRGEAREQLHVPPIARSGLRRLPGRPSR